MKTEAGDAVTELTGVQDLQDENRKLRAEVERLRQVAGLHSPEIEALVQERSAHRAGGSTARWRWRP